MLKMKLITGLIFVFLIGCANVSDKQTELFEPSVAENINEIRVDSNESTAISPHVLYLLMTAEIAGQRSEYGVALEGYLQAAKRVDDPRIAERAAKIGLFLKDTEKTDEAVSLWLSQDEKNLSARKIALLSALRAEDKNNAVKYLNGIIRDDPAGFESTLIELAKMLGKEGKAEFAFSVLDDVSKQHPDQAIVIFVQGLLAGQLNKVELAKEKVNAALLIEPEWDKALILQAQLAAQSGDMDLAIDNLEKVLKKTPENDRIRKMLAQTFIKTEAYDDAVQLYEEVLEKEPGDGESQFAIALIYLQQNKVDDAVIHLQKLVNKPVWDAQASFYLGRIEYKKEHYEKALVWFDKVTWGSYAYDASMAAVSMLLAQKNFVEAEQRLTALAVKYPAKQLNIMLLKADVYNGQKKYQEAYDVLSKELIENPEHRDLLYARALVAERLDKLNVLEDDLKKILLNHPQDASALNALGYTLADRTERYDEAENYLMQAIKLRPKEAVILDSFGWLQFKLGKTKDALKYLRSAYENQPETEIAVHLTEVLWVLGDRVEAKEIFNEALKKSPDDEYLLKFRQRFPDLISE